MNFRRIEVIICAFFLAAAFLPVPAQALSYCFSFQTDRLQAVPGDLVRLKIRADQSVAAAGFRAKVQYDDSSFRFVGTEQSSRLKSGTLRTNSASNPVCSVYVCNAKKGRKSAPKLYGTVLTYVFEVKKDASPDTAELDAQVDEICDYSGTGLSGICSKNFTLEISRTKSGKACLTALEPSEGKLSPEFDPGICRYTLTVASGVRSVSFRAEAAAGASVSVSRKSLGAAGTSTPIVIRVTSADKKNTQVYEVDVTRAAKTKRLEVSLPDISRARPSESVLSEKYSSPGIPPGGTAENPESAGFSDAGPSRGKASGSGGAARPESARSESGTAVILPAPPSAALKSAPAAINLVENRMPAYLVGMLACGFCIVTGIALELWLSGPKR
ncbi:MAG: cadherin-like beta sandwich domain-containing protein [Oscillospiraceae bacterium]|nr:cadherin-like beta sandwich domain-containing protein [Oscillospiraceae bacterium]